MKFEELAQSFDRIEAESSRLAMTALLSDILLRASAAEASIIVNLALGQLRPAYKGTQFHFATKNIIPVLSDVLSLAEEEVVQKIQDAGDASLLMVAGDGHIKKFVSSMTIEMIYEQLCELENIEGSGAYERRSSLLKNILRSLDPRSAKYVVRIVLGRLRLGFSDMTVIDALSWMLVGNKSLRKSIEDAYNLCADIGHLALVLKTDGVKALDAISVLLGVPIRPAAAERLPSAQEIFEKIGPCVAQPKIDGFRLQIHVDKTDKKPKIYFFSRNLQDMSAMFPDLVKVIEKLPVTTLICEGEAIAYHQDTGAFFPFQETVKRKRKHAIEEVAQSIPLKLFLFDVLYKDGASCLSLTHAERRKILRGLIDLSTEDSLKIIEERAISSAGDLEKYFSEVISVGLEGLVVKRPDSIYQPGKRNFNWIKLKRHEQGVLEDSLDCVVAGYYFGSGKRAHFGIGAFLVCIFNKNADRFETIAKVGTGLSDEAWVALRKKCDQHKIAEKPVNVACAKDLVPDVWVYPEIVCAIRADEITRSPVHSAGKTEKELGYALRFPRFIGYRADKSATDATTLDEIKSLFKMQYAQHGE